MTKPWLTDEWKARRAAIIKDKCEICGLGQAEGKVVVLHHPAELKEVRLLPLTTPGKILAQIWWDKYHNAPPEATKVIKADKEKYRAMVPPPAPSKKMVCQRGHTNIRLRKDQTWRCYTCRDDIDLPKEVYDVSPNDKAQFEKQAYLKFKTDYWDKAAEVAERLNRPIREHNEQANAFYMTLEGTVTLCRGCHLATHNRMIRCPQCNKKWMGQGYDQCFDCLPGVKKEEIKKRKDSLQR